MTVCHSCGKEFIPEPRISPLGAFLKLTSWRNPFLGFVIFWIVGGLVGIIQVFAETQDARLRIMLLGALIVICVLILDILSNIMFRSRRASRYCKDCINNTGASRKQSPEEVGPHKITIEKEKR